MINRYELEYFDTVEWAYIRHTILAESEEQAREFADMQREPQYRRRQLSPSKHNLTIRLVQKDIILPYEVG